MTKFSPHATKKDCADTVVVEIQWPVVENVNSNNDEYVPQSRK